MLDLDGTLTGGAGNVVVSAGNITAGDSRCSVSSAYLQGAVCKQTNDWIRFSFNNANPYDAVLLDVENSKGDTDIAPKLQKRLTHPKGYMTALEANQVYNLNFEQADFPTNISYTGIFYSLKPNQYVIIAHKLLKKPDQVTVLKDILATESTNPLSINSNANTDWYWENITRTLSYIIHNKQGTLPFLDVPVAFDARKCRFANCQLPQQPALKLPATKRPDDAVYWSNYTTWNIAKITRAIASTSTPLPAAGDTVKIPDGLWVVVDIVLPALTRIEIDGVLEFDDSLDNKLIADEVFINGGQLIVGWENQPFTHNMEIILTGNKASHELILPNGFDSMGSKAIGVYGGLDLHGIPRTPSWTRLSQTAYAGTNKLTLIESVDWQIGEEIVISTTSYDAFQTETFKITGVANNVIQLNASLVYDHVVISEKFLNGKSYSVAAGVGLLTRNVKVTGAEYPGQFDDLFGSRIIVSDYSDYVYPDDNSSIPTPVLVYYKGYARISDTEFKHFGQFSRLAADDYKYGILLSDLGAYDPARPNYVRNSAFHDGFAAAIGIFNCQGMPIENNSVHRTLDYSIRVEGNSNIIRNNLVVLNIWSPTFIVAEAPFYAEFWGAIDIHLADSAVVEDNLIAGSQRVGINFRGSPCVGENLGNSSFNHSIKGNSIYGTVAGVTIFPPNTFSLSCLSISGFTIYKASSVGIYYQGAPNIVIDSNVVVDSQLSIFPQVTSPSSLSHFINPNRSIIVSNNIVIGTSPNFNCKTDLPPKDLNSQYLTKCAPYGANNDGRIGIVWANFIDRPNGAPYKPWYGIMSYNYINGLSTITGNTFAHFKSSCGLAVDAVITSSKGNDDGQMPVLIEKTYLYDVASESKIYLHRPNIGKINPSDCVDMDCDGMKKNLLIDADGTFLGTPGTVISQSEYEWGSQSRGLGDFRIPNQALADASGHMVAPSSIYSYPGIVRDQSLCKYVSAWEAYECHGLEYRMLVIESMDNDTESRRLSPVAILSDNKYLDLINGPQDHGWCFGYTCQKRISTFLALVAANKHYDVFLSSTPPDQIRFRIINSDANFKIRLSLSYTTSNNINVYKNVNLIDPTNADRSSGSLMLKDPLGNENVYLPAIGSPSGTNYVSRTQQKTYFSIDGSDYIDLIVAQEIFLTFGVQAITTDTFFNSANLVSNIATLLGVPASMIRRVEIVKATGITTRLVKRNAGESISQLLVTIATNAPSLSTDATTTQINKDQIASITSSISSQFYFNQLQTLASNSGLIITSLTLQTNGNSTTLQKIGSLKLLQDASQCRAQSPCVVQPILQLLDTNVSFSFDWYHN